MKILYLHQYFKTPEQGGAIRSYHLAKALTKAGFEVEIITTHNRNTYQKRIIEGFVVHYLPIFYDNKLDKVARIKVFLKYFWQSYRLARKIKDTDLVYATSTPLTVGLTALILKKLHRKPYYFEVRDLWPQAPIELGFIRNYFLKNILYFLEKKIYENARKTVALSPYMQSEILKKIKSKTVYCIPNMSDCEFFQLESKKPELVEKFGVMESFVITYFGTLGIANHLEYLLNIASYFKKKQIHEVKFLIVGEGGRANFLKEKARSMHLENLHFLPQQDKKGIKEILNITDAVYISFWNKKILESNSPNKFFDALAAGKLCLINTKGWLRRNVEAYKCGFYADPQKPEDFYRKICPFLKDENLLRTHQENARLLAEDKFSKEKLSRAFLKLFYFK